jgi:glycosyltransferase involved in cell wall biosynthesis
VIIPTRNRAALLKGALLSTLDQSYPSDAYEIIVVDNASTDQTRQVTENIAESNDVAIRYILEDNIGLHHARNCGALHARTDFILYGEDDIVAEKDWIERIYVAYQKDPRAGAVGGKIIGRWMSTPPTWIFAFGSEQNLGALGLIDLGEDFFPLANRQYVYGGNFAIRRSLLLDVGGFNPDGVLDAQLMYRGDGEIGLQKKLRRNGHEIFYTGKAVVHHVIDADRLTLDYFYRRYYREGFSRAYSRYRDNRGNLIPFALGSFISGMRMGYYKVGKHLFHDSNMRIRSEAFEKMMLSDIRHALRILRDNQLKQYILQEGYL